MQTKSFQCAGVLVHVNRLKHFHAVRKDWRILGENAWRKESRDASRRGFNGCVTGILWLISTERYGSVQNNIE